MEKRLALRRRFSLMDRVGLTFYHVEGIDNIELEVTHDSVSLFNLIKHSRFYQFERLRLSANLLYGFKRIYGLLRQKRRGFL